MKKVYLTQGFEAIIDSDSGVDQHKWCAYNLKRGVYAGRSVNKKTIYMHRVIAGAQKGQFVDHINGNKLDNRRANLRICTNAENLRKRSNVNGNTKYKGVHKVANRKDYFIANIGFDGKKIYLGAYRTAEAAALAYNKAAVKYHGDFACLNVVKYD